jgi:glutathione synthase/RimK-type ligase-like ATP-grasp enzyme
MGWASVQTNSYVPSCTTQIRKEDLEENQSLSACPGIFQAHIEKSYEVRVTVIGKTCYALKLYSQKNENSIDWRASIQTAPFPVEQLSLPTEINKKILQFMGKSHLLFGCFDFIVTSNEEWIFLEVNPMGQFLWVEELCPEIKLLDAFCRLLVKDETPSATTPINYQYFIDNHWNKTGAADLRSAHIDPKPAFIAIE